MLITCDECGRKISDKSLSCPGCGYPTHLQSALKQPEATAEPVEPKEPAEPAEPKEPVKPEKPVEPVKPGKTDAAPTPEASEEEDYTVPPSRKERHKLWAFVVAFALLLAAVWICYFIGAAKSDDADAPEPEATEAVEAEANAPEPADTIETAVEAPAPAPVYRRPAVETPAEAAPVGTVAEEAAQPEAPAPQPEESPLPVAAPAIEPVSAE